MKQIVCMLSVVCSFIFSFGQESKLLISSQKTTSLIFPFPVRHVDRGTKDVLVEPVKEANNILLVKAASPGFAQTSLSVITEDGSVYSFVVTYGDAATLVYHFPVQDKTPVLTYANSILDNPKTVIGIKDASWEMVSRLIGIYIKDDVLYFQLRLTNQSSIDYDVNSLRFYIRDKKKAKRTAIQEVELTPVCIAGNVCGVKARTETVVVVALEKFTIPDAKYLAIEIGEKNGGRNLLLKVGNRHIVKALLLPDLKPIDN